MLKIECCEKKEKLCLEYTGTYVDIMDELALASAKLVMELCNEVELISTELTVDALGEAINRKIMLIRESEEVND